VQSTAVRMDIRSVHQSVTDNSISVHQSVTDNSICVSDKSLIDIVLPPHIFTTIRDISTCRERATVRAQPEAFTSVRVSIY
jgi:hypothetical protein